MSNVIDPRQMHLFNLPPPVKLVVEVEETLPESMRLLVESGASPETVQLLIERLPGCRVRVPRTPTDKHYLVKVMGIEAAEELARLMPGFNLDVPRAKAAQLAIRNAQIRRDYDHGVTMNELALRYELTCRMVGTILGEGE